MQRAIREHLRDFLAIVGLMIVAVVVDWIIVQEQRLRIPVLEETPFELKAEMETAQAVTPGQGQTVRVAGVRVGDIAEVEFDDGIAVVTMDIDRKFLPVYQDATMLLRPEDRPQGHVPGARPRHAAAGRVRGGRHDPGRQHRARRQPRRGPRGCWTRTPRPTCACCSSAPARASRASGENLGELLGSLGPINSELARLNGEVAKRKENLANLVHNMNIFCRPPRRGGRRDRRADRRLQLLAGRDRRARTWTSSAPPACSARRSTTRRIALAETNELATVLGPTLHDLRPFARKLKPINESLGELARSTTRRRQAQDPARSCARPASRSATCGRPPRSSPRRPRA